jgi:hypothetical protein
MAPIAPSVQSPVRGVSRARSDRITGGIAVIGGVVGLMSVASLGAFFAVGGPFGAINDWMICVFGLLTGLLALGQSRRDGTAASPHGVMAVALALLGAAIVVLGSYLVISDTTGFLLAGLVESLGFALIGVWLIVINRSVAGAPRLPRGLRQLGVVAGLVMAIGFTDLPGVTAGLDEASVAPIWVWIGLLGWLGTFLLYPLWCIWFGLQSEGSLQDIRSNGDRSNPNLGRSDR